MNTQVNIVVVFDRGSNALPTVAINLGMYKESPRGYRKKRWTYNMDYN